MNTELVETLKTAGDTPVLVVFQKSSGRVRQVEGIVGSGLSETHVVIRLERGHRIISLDSIQHVSLQIQSPG